MYPLCAGLESGWRMRGVPHVLWGRRDLNDYVLSCDARVVYEVNGVPATLTTLCL